MSNLFLAGNWCEVMKSSN